MCRTHFWWQLFSTLFHFPFCSLDISCIPRCRSYLVPHASFIYLFSSLHIFLSAWCTPSLWCEGSTLLIFHVVSYGHNILSFIAPIDIKKVKKQSFFFTSRSTLESGVVVSIEFQLASIDKLIKWLLIQFLQFNSPCIYAIIVNIWSQLMHMKFSRVFQKFTFIHQHEIITLKLLLISLTVMPHLLSGLLHILVEPYHESIFF